MLLTKSETQYLLNLMMADSKNTDVDLYNKLNDHLYHLEFTGKKKDG